MPSWDLQTLWVSGDISYRGGHADVMPIDPRTGKLGKAIDVPDSYNLYFTPDGKSAIMVAEAMRRLEFRDPHTHGAAGLHRDAAVPGHQPRRLFARRLLRDLHLRIRQRARQDRSRPPHARRHAAAVERRHAAGHPRRAGRLGLLRRRPAQGRRRAWSTAIRSRRSASSRPASARTGSIPAATERSSTSPIAAPTTSRASRRARAASRCSTSPPRKVVANWTIPGGGSPDMGNLSADGKWLWLSGRYDGVIYAFNTDDGVGQDDPRRRHAAWADRLAAAGALFARAHRQHAVATSGRRPQDAAVPLLTPGLVQLLHRRTRGARRADRLRRGGDLDQPRAHPRLPLAAEPGRRGADRAGRRDHRDGPHPHARTAACAPGAR